MSATRIFSLSLAATLLLGCQSHGEDELATDYSRTDAYAEGVPGGAVQETEELSATVSAVDTGKRTFTLKDDLGNSKTLRAPEQMHNFDQLKVGDRVRAVITQERIVYLRQPGEPAEDGGAGMLATAPLGDKPGMLAADTVEITAWVKGMDTTLRTATLRLADGSERTIKVRPDVEMKNEYLGRQVVLRVTTAVAINVVPQ
ncbi:hypothetical protein [Pseudomonas sp. Gutcm_11s]|uniref:hypothetical protein n=1 Tax=Pseudomonas sp. Gutcm_11s TaxID=3026088 RepID=UPI002360611A|nr:hypothetical protein [Pseudomonas sp. Gutcm_11s]MDD0843983.1 hypothetical protein [Pseudomonas sp. Gutcm_11s]